MQQEHAEAEGLGATDTVIKSMDETFPVRDLKTAPETDADMRPGAGTPPEDAGPGIIQSQGPVQTETVLPGLGLHPCLTGCLIQQGKAFAVTGTLTASVKGRYFAGGIGQQVEGIRPMLQKSRGDIFDGPGSRRAPVRRR
mgnify:CR=1 FL=1